jgi:hypothetical protein
MGHAGLLAEMPIAQCQRRRDRLGVRHGYVLVRALKSRVSGGALIPKRV